MQTRITTPQVCAMFDVSHLTVLNWRKGTATKKPLPVLKPAKDEAPNAVRFDRDKVLAWAEKNGVTIVTRNPKVATSKPRGPKPKKA